MQLPAYDHCFKGSVTVRLIVLAVLVALTPLHTIDARQPISSGVRRTIQQSDGRAAIRIEEGMLFVWNLKDLHFTLVIKGKEIKPLDDADHIFFNVDGMVLQVQMAAISDFIPDRQEKKLDDTAILAAHRDWESKFLEGLLHSKLKVQSENSKLSSGSDVMLWQFDMPEGANVDAKKQIYLTVVNKEYILMLNSVAGTSVSEEAARKLLQTTLATLKLSPTAIDIGKLSDAIRAGNKPY
jgi:hypothetical protein